MESREDLKSILAYLSVLVRSDNLFWPSKMVESLKAMAKGPDHSRVNCGEVLSVAICDIRNSLSLFEPLSPFALEGYALFFDELISRAEAAEWFREVVPALANLLLQFPSLLENHYQNADDLHGKYGIKSGLRLLGPQEAGIVFLSQELIGALLACAFFCFFPVTNRGANHLPTINFDELFASLYESYSEKLENKIKCLVHYFKRICSWMPAGYVSFERKVLPLDHRHVYLSYPEADFWSKSVVPLCPLEVHSLGSIEDQSVDALEVDFANKYIGGGALHRGCVQEEIRFNSQIIRVMRRHFSFAGDHVDKRNFDNFGRHKTRIIAIDALCMPGMKQYALKFLLRETNKAFCGFIDQSKYCQYERIYSEASSTTVGTNEGVSVNPTLGNSERKNSWHLDQDCPGIATGNWGCGAFGGDPELKTIIQWLAASQALRPFISYHTFGIEALQNLGQVTQWILLHEWTVGDLWNMVVEYSSQRLKRETDFGFFSWLLPMLSS
ncbi:Poly(ADP-ribose) glycohydrolase 1 [Melia azedarach]|uniref:Poly(ADP-ribose) glycohydrolase 1 n=1 Tax=Melia azedarach TaxID=155640 RepID=A0ACC1YKG5_MELAZ|nr:Poly(ADP-ribose) glycohydrolase 1 [Melia azedarach]